MTASNYNNDDSDNYDSDSDIMMARCGDIGDIITIFAC